MPKARTLRLHTTSNLGAVQKVDTQDIDMKRKLANLAVSAAMDVMAEERDWAFVRETVVGDKQVITYERHTFPADDSTIPVIQQVKILE